MRILLKISGEALMGDQEFGICGSACASVAQKVSILHKAGHEVAIVTGGGNLFRGIQQGEQLGLERTPADQIGMLSTLINGVAFKQALIKAGCPTHLFSALDCPKIADSYQWDKAMASLKRGEVLLFVGGTGHPYFTTDTNAALRACEIGADLLLKATMHVDGAYDKDPRKHDDAKLYSSITFAEVLDKQLGIMDLSAISMCMEANIPIRVFNFTNHTFEEALTQQPGTLIENLSP